MIGDSIIAGLEGGERPILARQIIIVIKVVRSHSVTAGETSAPLVNTQTILANRAGVIDPEPRLGIIAVAGLILTARLGGLASLGALRITNSRGVRTLLTIGIYIDIHIIIRLAPLTTSALGGLAAVTSALTTLASAAGLATLGRAALVVAVVGLTSLGTTGGFGSGGLRSACGLGGFGGVECCGGKERERER